MDHDCYCPTTGAICPDSYYITMSLQELETTIDAELIAATAAELLPLSPEKRKESIDSFAEIDPILANKLRLAIAFELS